MAGGTTSSVIRRWASGAPSPGGHRNVVYASPGDPAVHDVASTAIRSPASGGRQTGQRQRGAAAVSTPRPPRRRRSAPFERPHRVDAFAISGASPPMRSRAAAVGSSSVSVFIPRTRWRPSAANRPTPRPPRKPAASRTPPILASSGGERAGLPVAWRLPPLSPSSSISSTAARLVMIDCPPPRRRSGCGLWHQQLPASDRTGRSRRPGRGCRPEPDACASSAFTVPGARPAADEILPTSSATSSPPGGNLNRRTCAAARSVPDV